MRNKYVNILYDELIQNLRQKATNKKIWVSLDETQDSEQRYVANFIFGIMDETERKKSYLLNVTTMEKVNSNSTSAFLEFSDKFEAVMRRNPGYEILTQTKETLYNGKAFDNEYIHELSPNELYSFKYCPVTTCDVERSSSKYRIIFTDNRKCFHFENLRKFVIVNCNNNCDFAE